MPYEKISCLNTVKFRFLSSKLKMLSLWVTFSLRTFHPNYLNGRLSTEVLAYFCEFLVDMLVYSSSVLVVGKCLRHKWLF